MHFLYSEFLRELVGEAVSKVVRVKLCAVQVAPLFLDSVVVDQSLCSDLESLWGFHLVVIIKLSSVCTLL